MLKRRLSSCSACSVPMHVSSLRQGSDRLTAVSVVGYPGKPLGCRLTSLVVWLSGDKVCTTRPTSNLQMAAGLTPDFGAVGFFVLADDSPHATSTRLVRSSSLFIFPCLCLLMLL